MYTVYTYTYMLLKFQWREFWVQPYHDTLPGKAKFTDGSLFSTLSFNNHQISSTLSALQFEQSQHVC